MLEPLPKDVLPLPSNRVFGGFFVAVFAAAAAYAYWKDSRTTALALAGFSGILAIVALAAPALLAPLNRLWFNLGLLLGRIVNPLVLGVIFFVLITPVSLITRLFGRDALRLKRETAKTYWIDRVPPGPQGDSFKQQF